MKTFFLTHRNQIITVVLLFLCNVLYGQQVFLDEAMRVAETILYKKTVVQKSDTRESGLTYVTSNRYPNLFMFNRTGGGWVIISGDKRCEPLLAYSHEGFLSLENSPEVLEMFLEAYNLNIDSVKNDLSIPSHSAWLANSSSVTATEIVAPLLRRNGCEVLWKQSKNADNTTNYEKNYNKFCPSVGSGCEHAMVGCVAVAIAQVMWYWRWPYAATTSTNSTIRCYDWDNMPAQIYNETETYCVDQIAHLLHDVGVSVNMNYGCGVSLSNTYNAVSVMPSIYSYDAGITTAYRNDYSNSWFDTLKNELNAQRPILYAGRISQNNGHSFVLDGYDSSDHFHINYGWGENYNGYFSLDAISYINNQYAVLNVKPSVNCNYRSLANSDFINDNFIYQYGGIITIQNNTTIDGGKNGAIISGSQISIGNNVTINTGSELYFGVENFTCPQ